MGGRGRSLLSTLTLIRHGQVAGLHDGNRLSETGQAQARAIARWWLQRRVTFDEVYKGSLERHAATECAVAAEFAEATVAWPRAEIRPGWDEYDAPGVLQRLAPVLAARDQRFAALHRVWAEAAPAAKARAFQRMFEIAMLAWLEGAEVEGVEPWPVFRDRVREEIAAVMGASGNARRVAVFTSGGPIGVAVQTAMTAPDRSFLEVNWRVRYGSVTEFVFGGGRFTLDSFNSIAHLEAALQTWR